MFNNKCYAKSGHPVGSGTSLGGGIYSDTGNMNLINCIVAGNQAISSVGSGGGGSYTGGGGISVYSGSLTMANSIISSNVISGSTITGGGVFLYSQAQNASLVNCTLAYNNPEAFNSEATSAQLLNSIAFFNASGGTQVVGTTNVTYCDVQGGFTGVGNINLNPIFYGTDNLIIVSGSPCINAGNTNAIYKNVYFPPSIGKIRNDMGAHGGPGAGAKMTIQTWPQAEVRFYGGVPGYNYEIDTSTNLVNWQAAQQYQIAHLGDYMDYLETNSLPYSFYKLNLAP